MSERGLAVASYIPLPGLAYLFLHRAPRSRLVRFHARQGGLLTLLCLGGIALMGLLATSVAPVFGAVAAVPLVWGLCAIVVGIVGASRGRYPRIRIVWDLLTLRPSPRPR